jgi:hypothetical protein
MAARQPVMWYKFKREQHNHFRPIFSIEEQIIKNQFKIKLVRFSGTIFTRKGFSA